MKTSKIKLGLLIAAVAPFLMGCPKSKPVIAPEPDTELQSSADASFANFVVTDMDMVCSFIAEGSRPVFYDIAPNENTPITLENNPDTYQMVAGWNSTHCMDGSERDGSIFLYNTFTNPNARYYRDFDFKGNIVLESYKINGWAVKIPAGKSLNIYNNVSSPVYDPSKVKLSWIIEGSLEFIHPTDPSKNMTWNGKLTKTLVNSTDPSVFNTSTHQAINWAKGVVEYTGEVTGVTSGNVAYKMVIDAYHPLVRDFTCYPNLISGVTQVQPTVKTWSEEFHPVKSGIATFETGNKYPRQIYYGNEGNPELALQCDNTGEVLIKGNSYRLDFNK